MACRQAAALCGLRALIVWAPPTALLAASRYVHEFHPVATDLSLSLWIATIILLLGYVSVALLFPSRCLHDRLAGTVLVPL